MKVTSYFLHMGTNFLRLVRYTSTFMDRWMQAPTIGHPPALASLIADELEDYFVNTNKNHIDVGTADPGAWSSDEEAGVEVEVGEDEANAQKDRRRRTWLDKDHLICFSNRFSNHKILCCYSRVFIIGGTRTVIIAALPPQHLVSTSCLEPYVSRVLGRSSGLCSTGTSGATTS